MRKINLPDIDFLGIEQNKEIYIRSVDVTNWLRKCALEISNNPEFQPTEQEVVSQFMAGVANSIDKAITLEKKNK